MKRDTRCPICGRNEWIRKERPVKSKKIFSGLEFDPNWMEHREPTEVVYVCKYDGYEKKVD